MITRPTAVICTGYGQHSRTEIVVLVPVHGRPDLAAMREDAGMPQSPPTADELRGYGVEGSRTTFSGVRTKVRHKREAHLVNTPGVGWQVVAQGCPRCGGGLVAPVAHIVARAEAENAPGVRRVDVDIRHPSGTIG